MRVICLARFSSIFSSCAAAGCPHRHPQLHVFEHSYYRRCDVRPSEGDVVGNLQLQFGGGNDGTDAGERGTDGHGV